MDAPRLGRYETFQLSQIQGAKHRQPTRFVSKDRNRARFEAARARATAAARQYRRKRGLGRAALAALRHAEALRRPPPLARVSSEEALTAAHGLLRVGAAAKVEGPMAQALERRTSGPGVALDRYDASRAADAAERAGPRPVNAAEKSGSGRRPRRVVIEEPPAEFRVPAGPHAASPKKASRSGSRSGSRGGLGSRASSRGSRPRTATVPEHSELDGPTSWPFAEGGSGFFDREAVDPEDAGRSLLSRAGSITRAERRAARGEAPATPELGSPGKAVLGLQRRNEVIGPPRCPSVQGWRRGPPEVYVRNCERFGLVPEPKHAKLLETLAAAQRPVLKLSHQSVGDDVLRALAVPVARADPVEVRLRNCRLGAAGVAAAARDMCLRESSRLEVLDLSENDCARADGAVLELQASPAVDALRVLHLRDCRFSADACLRLAQAWGRRERPFLHLRELDLAKNALGTAGADLGDALGANGCFPALRVLDVSWAGLAGAGAAAVARGLGRSVLNRVDLSWNAFRADDALEPRADDAVAGLAESLGASATLWHLDLSFNHLSGLDLRRLEVGARASRTLAGLHLAGNDVAAARPLPPAPEPASEEDAPPGEETKEKPRTFLVDGKWGEEDPESLVFSRTIGTKDVPQSLAWRRGSTSDQRRCCWICQRWREERFCWTCHESDRAVLPGARATAESLRLEVAVRCAFDDWGVHGMAKQEAETHEVWLLVPPGPTRPYVYQLSAGEEAHVESAADQERLLVDRKRVQTSLWAGAFDEYENSDECFINKRRVPPGDWEDVRFQAIAGEAAPAAAVVVKEPWTWQKSMFAPLYEGECDAAFERDWELANLDKLAGDDGGAAKETTRRAYGLFRTLFKLYCCQNKTLHTLGWNDFTEFVDDSGVCKGANVRKADNDMIFFATCGTGPKSPLNPKKSLCRFQFMDAALKIANLRWRKSGEVETLEEAVRNLVEGAGACVGLRAIIPLEDEPDAFHFDRVWREDVEDAVRKNLEGLKRCYKQNSGREDALSKHKLMCFPEFLEFAEAIDLVDVDAGFTERDVNLCFLRATRTPKDELHDDHAPHRKLDFIHFIEALLRVGDKLAVEARRAQPGSRPGSLGSRPNSVEHARAPPDEAPAPTTAHEHCIALMGRVAYAFPSGAEKRRRAKEAADREKAKRFSQIQAAEQQEKGGPKKKLGALLKAQKAAASMKSLAGKPQGLQAGA